MSTIHCCDCGFDKPKKDFPKGKVKLDRCKICARIFRQVWWAKWYHTVGGRARWMLQNAKVRAKARHTEFSLSLEWAVSRLQSGVCEATGLPFDFSTDHITLADWAHPLAPSIERKNPVLGYTADNCEVIVWLLNRAKANFDRTVFDQVMAAYIKRKNICHTLQL